MKKLLLGSTALVAGGLMAAPAMAADPIKIGVGGYYQFFALAGSIEGVYAPDGTSIQYKGLQFIQEGEIHFIGQSKLDNGTTVGLTVELEGWNTASSQSSTSAVRFGPSDRRSVPVRLRRLGPPRSSVRATRPPTACTTALRRRCWAGASSSTTRRSTGLAGAMLANPAQGAATFFTIGGQFQDVNRVNYFTPRFMGLQVGVGYAPKINIAPNAMLASGLTDDGPGAGCGWRLRLQRRDDGEQLPDQRQLVAGHVRRRRQLPEQVR